MTLMFPKPTKKKRAKHRRPATAEEKAHMDWVASQPCIVADHHCNGPIEVHHILEGRDGRLRCDMHFETLPLCRAHHRTGGFDVAIHMGRKRWVLNYASERVLLDHLMRRVK